MIFRDGSQGKSQAQPDGGEGRSVITRKEISKPDGGVRLLGIPTVLDRLIQQALAQVVPEIWDPTFSNSSFGFRPGRSQRKAILRAKSQKAAERVMESITRFIVIKLKIGVGGLPSNGGGYPDG